MKKINLVSFLVVALLLLSGCSASAPGGGSSANVQKEETAPAKEETVHTEEETVPTEKETAHTEQETKTTEQETKTAEEETALSDTETPRAEEARPAGVYLGVKDYGKENTDKNHILDFLYRFFVDGKEHFFRIADKDGTFALQNLLEEGALYYLSIDGDLLTALERANAQNCTVAAVGRADSFRKEHPTVKNLFRVTCAAGGAHVSPSEAREGETVYIPQTGGSAYIVCQPEAYTPPVSGTAGEKTLKNLLQTALTPLGTTLYIYGGGWDWQDEGSSPQATAIGLPAQWYAFFSQNDASYEYKGTDPERSYYPFGAYNEYYYAGLDCSGYLGWVLYNVMNTESGGEGLVGPSTRFAARLESYGWGNVSKERVYGAASGDSMLRPGDIVSIRGHVWVCLGVCEDGSMVICHSTVSDGAGSGVQLSAIGESDNCTALALARAYMQKYCPAWSARYDVSLKNPAVYFDFSNENAGVFRFDRSLLADPDGIAEMSAEQVLQTLFGEE